MTVKYHQSNSLNLRKRKVKDRVISVDANVTNKLGKKVFKNIHTRIQLFRLLVRVYYIKPP